MQLEFTYQKSFELKEGDKFLKTEYFIVIERVQSKLSDVFLPNGNLLIKNCQRVSVNGSFITCENDTNTILSDVFLPNGNLLIKNCRRVSVNGSFITCENDTNTILYDGKGQELYKVNNATESLKFMGQDVGHHDYLVCVTSIGSSIRLVTTEHNSIALPKSYISIKEVYNRRKKTYYLVSLKDHTGKIRYGIIVIENVFAQPKDVDYIVTELIPCDYKEIQFSNWYIRDKNGTTYDPYIMAVSYNNRKLYFNIGGERFIPKY